MHQHTRTLTGSRTSSRATHTGGADPAAAAACITSGAGGSLSMGVKDTGEQSSTKPCARMREHACSGQCVHVWVLMPACVSMLFGAVHKWGFGSPTEAPMIGLYPRVRLR